MELFGNFPNIGIALLILMFLVFFHELGHFLAARFFGVHIEVFSIGFGKKFISKKIGATTYCLSTIPLGGYVQMKGQDDSDPTKKSLDKDSYNTKTPLQRMIISFAGPFANFVLAFLLYIAIAYLGIPKLTTQIGTIIPESSALSAGLISGDEILSINQTEVKTWDEIKPLILKSEGGVELLVKRDENTLLLTLTPRVMESKNIFGEPIQEKLIGITPSGAQVTVILPLSQSLNYALNQTYQSATLILKAFQKIITGILPIRENLGGPITIIDITSKAADLGMVPLLFLAAAISVNLGVLNLLPIPALDGGHIIFQTYELITRKPPHERIQLTLMYLGWILLLGLMIFAVLNDILRYVGNYISTINENNLSPFMIETINLIKVLL